MRIKRFFHNLKLMFHVKHFREIHKIKYYYGQCPHMCIFCEFADTCYNEFESEVK